MNSDNLPIDKLRMTLINCVCFAFSVRELQSSLFVGHSEPVHTLENLLSVNTSLNLSFRITLFVLMVVTGTNFWANFTDI
jgi:hypothetical protein